MLSGESGSGKSAILKEYYEQYKDNRDYVFFIINAGQLNVVDLNSLFHLHHDYIFADFYGYFAEVKNKILVLDSAEQLLDLNNRRVALMLVDKLRREGWNFIVTCKTNSAEDLISMLKEDFQLDFILQSVDALQDYELNNFE
jgi:alpha-D-ribose 1-methylphosphonate 5-triphosphate synthase subunit PhnL